MVSLNSQINLNIQNSNSRQGKNSMNFNEDYGY
jgi:hypothetical protein